MIQRELLLAKISILGPEYVDEQFEGGPFHEPRRHQQSKLEREANLAQNFERGAVPDAQPALTPSEALRLKHQHLHSITVLAQQFGAKVVDVSEHSVIVELTAKSSRVEAFLSLLKPFGILEAARTGLCCRMQYPLNQADIYFLQVSWPCPGHLFARMTKRALMKTAALSTPASSLRVKIDRMVSSLLSQLCFCLCLYL